jgi:dTDP-4-amino-4,6-dideoxygalactose transaminase
VTWRRQLPAYSPLPARALFAAAAGFLGGAASARTSVATALTRQYDADDVLLTDGGTGALTLALRASLAGASGAAAALPAYGCYDLATAADGTGAPVLLYDLDPATLAPDPGSLRSALDRGARAVVLAHWYGVPADPEPVLAAARSAGAIVIEDAAQGAGGSWRGRSLGSFGDLTVLSFGRGKGNTAGRGGALLAHGAQGLALLARARGQMARGRRGLPELIQLKAQWLLGRPALYAVPSALPFLRLGETAYHAPAPVRVMSAVATRTLAVTHPLGEREAEVRRANAARLLACSRADFTSPRVPDGGVAGYLRLPFLASPAARAAALSTETRALGVMPGYPLALCDLAGFAERAMNRGDAFPGARQLAMRLVTLPTHSLLTESDLSRLESWFVRAGN